MHIEPPHIDHGNVERFMSCQDALQLSFRSLALSAVDAGWSPGEVAAALVELADNHLLTLIATGQVEGHVRKAKSGR